MVKMIQSSSGRKTATIAYLLAVSVFTLCVSTATYAQLNGSYSIGTGQTYTTVSAFVAALNLSGVSGPVTATVQPGTYTGSFSINAVTGASSTNTITIQGANVSTCIIEAATSTTGSYVIQLNAADYVRIRNLTINANGTYGFGISMTAAADYNEITGCKINCLVDATSSYCVPILGGSGTATTYSNHANYNLIENNTITGGYYGIRLNGTSSSVNCAGNRILGNTITGYYYAGVHSYYQSSVQINENTCIASGTYSSSYGLYVYYNRTSPQIKKNYTRSKYYGIYCYYGNQDAVSYGEISNNMVVLDGSSTQYGLYVYYNYKMNVWNNSVNFMTSSTAYGMYLYGYSTSGHDVRNNIIKYNGTGTCYFVYGASGTTGYFNALSHNVFYHPLSSYTFYHSSTYYYDVASVQLATGLYSNTVTANPEFVSNWDLHTYSLNVYNNGSGIPALTMDFDGDPRSATTPDRGCDEFALYAVDAGAAGISAPLEACGLTSTEPLTILIKNYGTATLNAATNNISVQASITGPMNQNFSGTMTSGTIAPGGTVAFTITNSFNLSLPGTYIISATANAVGDGNSNNAAMPPVTFKAAKTVAAFPYNEDFESDDGGWSHLSLGGSDDWEWGDPTYSGFTNANSGTYCWATKLGAAYSPSANAALVSPCLNFASLTSPVMTFYMAYDGEDYYDGLIVEASGNGGSTWTKLNPVTPAYTFNLGTYGPVLDPYYSGYYPTWTKHVFALPAYALNADVRVRFHYGSDGSVQYAGWLIDDVSIGNFYEKDIAVDGIWYNNATDFWTRRLSSGHKIEAHIRNAGYENNPTTVTLTYKAGSMPASVGDGISQTFTPSWIGNAAVVTFNTEYFPPATGNSTVYVKAFYTGDQGTSNDLASMTVDVRDVKTYGYEMFDLLTPPEWEKDWKTQDNNGGTTWALTAGNGIGGSNSATYPGDVAAADDWLITPSALLGAGASYSIKFKYRSRTGAAQRLEIAWGPSPDPATMTVFATFNHFTNTAFIDAIGPEGVPPYFNTPNTAQGYYVGFRVSSNGNAGPLDLDDVILIENPTPPPKISYGNDPAWIDDPTVPILFTGVYKKSGMLLHTFTVINATGKYGVPEGDMLWDVTTTTPWLKLIKSTPDPLSYLSTNPFTPPWCRQWQTFTLEVNPSNLLPGTLYGSITLDAFLYNVDYVNGIRASNAPFQIPVQVTISAPGGTGQNPSASMTKSGMTSAGNPWVFADGQGNVFANVNVTAGTIPSMTITSYPGQLPKHISRYRYVDHYWEINAPGTGWNANIEFHYFDSEVLSGGVIDENYLRAMRIAPKTSFWEDPIRATSSNPDANGNFVHVTNINPTNFAGMIALAHDWLPGQEQPGKANTDVCPDYALDQNYPNPFNPATTLSFSIAEDAFVTLSVTNGLGEEVARLVNESLDEGSYTVKFDASHLPSGVYMYTIRAGAYSQTRTMLLAK